MMRFNWVIVLGLLALWEVAESVPTAWAPFYPVQKRTVLAEGDDAASTAGESPSQQIPPSPINPFLAFGPFIPVKPTFAPPVVDPKVFIDQKTALLNSLFSSIVNADSASATAAPKTKVGVPPAIPSYFLSKKAELFPLFSSLAPKSSAPASSQTVKRALTETNVVPSSSDAAVAPSVFADKKASFLENLLNILNLTDTDGITEDSTVTPKPTIVPPNFWFPVSVAENPVTPKPTIVPASFWAPFASSPDATVTKTPPVIDPKVFIDKKTTFLNTLFANLAVPPKPTEVPTTKAPIVPPSYWIPPAATDTAALYEGKVSEFLDKLLNSLNITTAEPVSTSRRAVDEAVTGKRSGITSIERRLIGPPVGFAPVVSPKVFLDKKTEFLGKLFASLSTPAPSAATDPVDADTPVVKPTIVPPSFWSPFASDTAVEPETPTTVKPTIVPPNFWSPFAAPSNDKAGSPVADTPTDTPAPVVDPSVFLNKKTQFLDTLFKSLNISSSAPSSDVPAKPAETNDTAVFANLLASILQPAEIVDSVSKRNVHRHNDDNISSEETFTDDLSKRTLEDIVNPADPLIAAKDKVVNSIITELGGIEDEMMTTVDDIIKQKQVVATSAASSYPSSFGPQSSFGFGGGKTFGATKKAAPAAGAGKKATTAAATKKKVAPVYGGGTYSGWPPTPTPDPTLALQEKLGFLNQVFEMLTQLQKDVTSAVNEAAGENATASSVGKREIQLGSEALPSNHNQLIPNTVTKKNEEVSKTRSIKMAVHQGYQSLPPGTEELIETGGGSETDEHEGGGLKLQIKVPL